MDELDVGDGGAGVVGHLLLELLDVGDCAQIDVQLEGLLLGGGFEAKLDHLKIYQIYGRWITLEVRASIAEVEYSWKGR